MILPCAPHYSKPLETFRRGRFGTDEKKPRTSETYPSILNNNTPLNKRIQFGRMDSRATCSTHRNNPRPRIPSEDIGQRFRSMTRAEEVLNVTIEHNQDSKQSERKITRPFNFKPSPFCFRRRSHRKYGASLDEKLLTDNSILDVSAGQDIETSKFQEPNSLKMESLEDVSGDSILDLKEDDAHHLRMRGRSVDSIIEVRNVYKRRICVRKAEEDSVVKYSYIPIEEEFEEGSSQPGEELDQSMYNKIINNSRYKLYFSKKKESNMRKRSNRRSTNDDYEKEASKIDQEIAEFIKMGIARKELLFKRHQGAPRRLPSEELVKMKAIIENMLISNSEMGGGETTIP